MQIGSANLLALQQATQNKQAKPQAASGFDAALAETGDNFEPLKFADASPAQEASESAPQAAKTPGNGPAQPPGSQLDIRV